MEIKELAFRAKMRWWAGYNNEDGESLHYCLVYLSEESDYTWKINKMIF